MFGECGSGFMVVARTFDSHVFAEVSAGPCVSPCVIVVNVQMAGKMRTERQGCGSGGGRDMWGCVPGVQSGDVQRLQLSVFRNQFPAHPSDTGLRFPSVWIFRTSMKTVTARLKTWPRLGPIFPPRNRGQDSVPFFWPGIGPVVGPRFGTIFRTKNLQKS